MKSLLPASAVLGISVLLGAEASEVFADPCGLALVLALDASKSMTSEDFRLAFSGTAAALRDEDVQSAILAQGLPIALSAIEWSGQKHQKVVHEWTMIQSREDIDAVATSLERHERGGIGQRTGTGSALQFSYALLEQGPACARRVIDLASDGYSSDGITPGEFYLVNPAPDVTVNVLVVGGKSRPHLWGYFNHEVIRGPDAFTFATIDFRDFSAAMKEKLLRELTTPQLSGTFGANPLP